MLNKNETTLLKAVEVKTAGKWRENRVESLKRPEFIASAFIRPVIDSCALNVHERHVKYDFNLFGARMIRVGRMSVRWIFMMLCINR